MLRYSRLRRLLDFQLIHRQFVSTNSHKRIETFMDPNVQSILKELTGRDFNRIFRSRKIGQKLREPRVTFMTEAQLEEVVTEAENRSDDLLQMPPVLSPQVYEEKVLSFDPRIQGHDNSAFVFTDISINTTNRNRLIVVRDLDGTLRHANPEERTKMNNAYFPIDHRNFTVPKMFSDPSILMSVLSRASAEDNTYEYILDRACVQFDPDDLLGISVAESTYNHVDETGNYDLLKSTRHYGPMVFYLTRIRKMDNLLLFNIQQERVTSDAVPLVKLFTLIFPDCKSKTTIASALSDVEKLRAYIQMDSTKRGELELCLNAYEEIQKSREDMEKGLQRSHGF